MFIIQKKNTILWSLAALFTAILMACGGGEVEDDDDAPDEDFSVFTPKEEVGENGIGPIKEVTLGEIDAAMAAQGKEVFTLMCTACHKMDKRHVGPPLGEVIGRRNPVWIMNMILNPEEMVAKDPVAKQLFSEFLSPMANQNLTEEQARQVLEYFRSYEMGTETAEAEAAAAAAPAK
jgi:cytochrome c